MKTKLFLTLFLIFVVIVSGFSFLVMGSYFIGINYYESEDIIAKRSEFMENLEKYEINPIDFEALKESIVVSPDEIHYYREFYGSLPAQLDNVRSQFESILADESLSKEERTLYEQQRDAKLEEIRKNFENDEVVRQKIRTIKEEALAKYEQDYERGKTGFQNQKQHFGYDLKSDQGESYISLKKGTVIQREKFTGDYEWEPTTHATIDLNYYLGGMPGISETSLYIEQQPKYLTGEVIVYKSALNAFNLAESEKIFKNRAIMFYILWALGIIAVVVLVFLKPARALFSWPQAEQLFARLPLDFQMVLPIITGILTISLVDGFPHRVYLLMDSAPPLLIVEEVVAMVLAFVFMSTFILTTLWFIDYVKNQGITEQNSLFIRVGKAVKESFLNKSIGKQTMGMFVIFFLGGVGFAGVMVAPGLLVIYIPLFMFVFLPTLYVYMKRMGYLNKVMKQTEQMAAGQLTAPINVKGKSPIAKHAANLNEVRQGIAVSMKEQAKSERLKTELITNVSHDLRTPLTSIITYTDLLKNPDLTTEERTKYIDIVDKKSARLKTLIEDLFEVSKMASGNIEIVRQQVDLAQMLQQTVVEHEEDFVKAGLDLRVTIQDQPIYVYVDGQKWWRVVDNLLNNARKYSLTGTRVYVMLKESNGVAEFTVKNVAKYELGENIEELTERFKRADTSRHTEGSGLGLAIAQSIVDLHNGQLQLDVDGDLFKVTVKVNTL